MAGVDAILCDELVNNDSIVLTNSKGKLFHPYIYQYKSNFLYRYIQ